MIRSVEPADGADKDAGCSRGNSAYCETVANADVNASPFARTIVADSNDQLGLDAQISQTTWSANAELATGAVERNLESPSMRDGRESQIRVGVERPRCWVAVPAVVETEMDALFARCGRTRASPWTRGYATQGGWQPRATLTCQAGVDPGRRVGDVHPREASCSVDACGAVLAALSPHRSPFLSEWQTE